MRKRRSLRGKSVPDYAALEPRGRGLMVASEKPFAFTHVDGRPVEQPEPEPMEVEATGGWAGLMFSSSGLLGVVVAESHLIARSELRLLSLLYLQQEISAD